MVSRFLLTAVTFVLLLTLSGCETRQESHINLPWQIELDANQVSTVFGVTLGKTTLKEAQSSWQGRPSVALFASSDKKPSLEAYFERITLGPFQVKSVVNLQADEAWLKSIQEQSAQPKPGPSGALKYPLGEADQLIAEDLPITEITYIPGYKVEGEILRQRFGDPDESKVRNENTTFWLYSKKGLIVAVNERGKDIFHYINPAEFSVAVAKLVEG